ncbi:hypothetical protein [Natrinema longum]|uniref:Uncharacterized protein n=1 Tax=Natrinema longum TaxID=370324 RepID=A0A8A2UCC1_9EURY|nr:hypothetical protein [Natrinema longum]MBZ6495662.1 hypothetical protein [Natrinema longum]QSW86379.1 hypothetical protein J0X27_06045 [Natrinema longum]
MSTDPTVTNVFEDVDPDPDAVLAEFGVDSTDDLLEDDAGAHDPIPDDAVDDTTATELFADLATVETAESTDPDGATPASNVTDTDSNGMGELNEAGGGTPTYADLEFEFVGDADVTVRADGEVIDATAAELGALTATDSSEPVPVDSSEPDDRVEPLVSPDAGPTHGTASTRTLTIRDERLEALELVGPEPTKERIADDTFGGVGIDTR